MASLSPHPNPGLLNQPNPLLALPPVIPQEKDAEEAAVSEERTGEEDKLQHHGQDRILEHLPARLNEGVPWGGRWGKEQGPFGEAWPGGLGGFHCPNWLLPSYLQPFWRPVWSLRT